MEFGASGSGMMLGLAVLLSVSNERGGGDLTYWGGEGGKYGDGRALPHDPGGERARLLLDHIVGRWGGDRIAIVGDYFEPDDLTDWGPDGVVGASWADEDKDGKNVLWKDISHLVRETCHLDHYTAAAWAEHGRDYSGSKPTWDIDKNGTLTPVEED